jgi:hypothetical protein
MRRGQLRMLTLIVVDLRRGSVSPPTAHPLDAVPERAVALADAFRARRVPMVLVNVACAAPDRTERVPDLNRQRQDHLVTKRMPGAFTNTRLDAHLQALGVTQVVIACISTSNGVVVTAGQAMAAARHPVNGDPKAATPSGAVAPMAAACWGLRRRRSRRRRISRPVERRLQGRPHAPSTPRPAGPFTQPVQAGCLRAGPGLDALAWHEGSAAFSALRHKRPWRRADRADGERGPP